MGGGGVDEDRGMDGREYLPVPALKDKGRAERVSPCEKVLKRKSLTSEEQGIRTNRNTLTVLGSLRVTYLKRTDRAPAVARSAC